MKILRDSRERKNYWTFAGKRCETAALKTGDYTIKGFEDKITIDRKKSCSEIAQNFNEDRFWREVERMKSFEEAYFIFEFTLEELINFPFKSKLPYYLKKKIRVRGPYLMKKIQEIEEAGIKVIFGGDRAGAIKEATNILNRFYEAHSKE